MIKIEKIIENILEQNKELFGENTKFEKINVGFTNTIYIVNENYVVKICTNPDNEKNFEKEINFYKANVCNNLIPKLYYSNVEKDVVPYYYEIIEHKAEPQKIINHDKYDGATYKKLVFKFDDKRYEMIYPIKCGDVSINKETRPWDLLPGTNGIEDHFITDLYKEVIKFFDICEDERIGYQIEPAYYGYCGSKGPEYAKDMSWVNDVRKEVLIDLFGDEKGPSVNYNDINILRHGFDLKQSFRKRKES